MLIIDKSRAEPADALDPPLHDGGDRAHGTRTHFYLIEETLRPTPPSATNKGRTTIVINGRYHTLRGRSASFRQLLRIAYPHKALQSPDMATMSFYGGVDTRPCGFLVPGDVIELISTLTINADATHAS